MANRTNGPALTNISSRALLGLSVLLLAACNRPNLTPSAAEWDKPSGRFQWYRGEVRLPQGLYLQNLSSDTFEGVFSTLDGSRVIHHDIGAYAGVYAQRENALFFEERIVNGARVWIAERNWGLAGDPTRLAAVTFPDNGCANFYVETVGRGGLEIIRPIADSFRPKRTQTFPGSCEQRGAGSRPAKKR